MIRMMDRIAGLAGWRRGALAFGSGMGAALSMPPLNFWPLLFVVVPVFLLLLESAKGPPWRQGLGAGWLFGFGYFAVAFHWIGFAFLVDAATYLWMMPFMLGALAGGMAIYWGLAAIVAKRLGKGGLPLAVLFAASIAAAEFLRGHLFTGFPWAAPGLASDGMGGLAQVAAYVGMPGLTLLIMLWAGLPYAMLRSARASVRITSALLILMLPVAWAAGTWRLAGANDEMVPDVSFRIVQPNIGQEQKWREDNARQIFDTLKHLSIAPTAARPLGIAEVTHVLWPESAVPFLIDESEAAKAELKPMLGGRTILITGSIRRGMDEQSISRIYNSIITFNGDAEPVMRYDKWRLVPGGEFLPFEWLLEPLGFRKVVTVPGSFAAGEGPVTLSVPGAPPAGMLVCYEAIFPNDLVERANRPGFLINVTNDGWFGRSTGPHQHLAQTRLRAIEQGLPILRAANTGISAVIDPYGRYLHQLQLLEAGVIDSSLPVALAPTVYARWGDLALLLMLILVASPAIFYQILWNHSPSRKFD
jgi:apolipoprotein N-acyltransferase